MIKAIHKIRAEMYNVDLLDNSVDIHVLCYPPGAGKSTFIRNFCNKHSEITRIGIASGRHNFLDETSKHVKNFEQWYGLGHEKSKCPKIKQIKWQLELGLHANTICAARGCDTSKCPYHLQFNNKQRAGFPTNYLETTYVHGFNIIFIEESMTDTIEYAFSPEKIIKGLRALTDCRPVTDFIDAVKVRDFQFMGRSDLLTEIDLIQRKAIRVAIKRKDKFLIHKIRQFDMDKFRGYLRFGEIYNFNNDEYYEPRFFKAFDLLKSGTRIVLVNATFDEEWFTELLDRYASEGNPSLTYRIHSAEAVNKKTRVYKITRSSFSKAGYDQKKVELFVEGIVKAYGGDAGVVTYKENTQQNVITGKKEFCGLPALNFGNTSGLNEFENMGVGIIIGTYALSLRQKVELYNQFHPREKLDATQFQPIIDEQVKKGSYPSLKGTELEPIERVFDDLQMYDAIHRFRGLIRNTKIFILGKVPVRIMKEFSCKTIEEGQMKKWLKAAANTKKSKGKKKC